MNPTESGSSAGAFPPTHWSVVLAAGHGGSADAAAALAGLCGAYWYPLYAFARRQGAPPADAEDLTQGFFEHLLRDRVLESAEAARGRFRNFLLRCFQNYCASTWQRSQAARRGGGVAAWSLNAAEAEQRFAREASDHRDPEALYHRAWALAVLEGALDRLQHECALAGRAAVFEALSPRLQGDDDASFAAAAIALDASEGTVRVMLHRLRNRYRALLREMVARTVGSPGEVEEELQHLKRTLREAA